MIKDNSLSDRLNSFKNKSTESISTPNTLKHDIVNVVATMLSFIGALIRIASYGFGIKIIFNTPWTILSTVCVGVFIHFILMYLYDLIHDKSL